MFRSRFLWKLYAGYVVLILLTAGIVGVLASNRIAVDSARDIERGLHDKAFLVREVCVHELARGDADRLQERIQRLADETGTRLTVIGAGGEVLADSHESPEKMDNHLERPEVVEARSSGLGSAVRFSHTVRREMMYVAIPMSGEDSDLGYLRASLPLTLIDSQLGRLRSIVLLAALLAALVALVLGFVFARRFTAPLSSITDAVQSMAAGQFERRVSLRSSDELGTLASSFNSMADELQRRVETINRDRSKLKAILGGIVEGVVAVDDSETIVHLNGSAARILGIAVEGSEGRPIWSVPNSDAVVQIIAQTLRSEQEMKAETRIHTGTRDLVVELFGSPLRDGDERTGGAVVVLHDITELRHLESVRRDFVANASHELKTPITAIRGLVETLIEDEEMPRNTHTRFLNRIKDQSTRLSALVSDLLTLSRLESRDLVQDGFPFDCRAVVRESVNQLRPTAEAKGLRMELELPEDPVLLSGDSADLRQVVDNLVDNAIKYTPPRGGITVRLAVRAGWAILDVEDTGIGIEKAHQDRIFERFYRVDQARSRELGGTGLGLAIVKHIAQSMGGSVRLQSIPGEGSTFTVEIPVPRVREPLSPRSF